MPLEHACVAPSRETASPPVVSVSPESLLHRLFDVMHMYQRKNGYVFSAWGELSLVEHQTLIELDQKIPRRPSDLAQRVNFPLAQLFHTLDSLKQRGLVRFVPGDSKREKLVFITAEGREIVTRLDDISNHQMNLLAEAGSNSQQQELYELWEALNNALAAPRTVARPGDHPLRVQARRYTRSFSYFSRKWESIDISYPDLQILFCLLEEASGASLDGLAQKLLVPRATLKTRLQKLHEKGLCTQPSEKRGVLVSATARAVETLEQARQSFARSLTSVLHKPILDHLARSLDVCASIIGAWQPDYSLSSNEGGILPKETYFLPLQVQVLSEYARHQFGILQPSLSTTPPTGTYAVVIFDGPTPCFSARVRQCGEGASTIQSLLIEEFGFSERLDWECASRVIGQCLEWGSGLSAPANTFLRCRLREGLPGASQVVPANSLPLHLGPRAEPLRQLLQLPLQP
jgi:DNA-binding MarR family transcriptional regulator